MEFKVKLILVQKQWKSMHLLCFSGQERFDAGTRQPQTPSGFTSVECRELKGGAASLNSVLLQPTRESHAVCLQLGLTTR